VSDPAVNRVECLWPLAAQLGEGPVWDTRDSRLYFVDIKAPAVHAYDPASGGRWSWPMPTNIGWVLPDGEAPGQFIAGFRDGFARLRLAPEPHIDYIARPHPQMPFVRLNDAKRHASGRIYAGSMHDTDADKQAAGRLYRLDPDGSWEVLDDGYHICNGPALSADGQTLFHTDSHLGRVYAYPLHEDGSLGERRLWRQFGDDEGSPDGMTVDARGRLWIAQWGGWCVSCFDADGTRLASVRLPVSQVSSCAFDPDAPDRLYVTTARVGLSASQLAGEPLAGGLFLLDVGGL